MEADAKNCVLLPSRLRTHQIPKGQGAFGQANVFYVMEADGTPRTGEWIAKALEFVRTYSGPNLVADPRLEYGAFAQRRPTWKERVEIASASIDERIADGEAVANLVENIDVGEEYIAHVDRNAWPQLEQIQKLLEKKKRLDAVKLYEALMVDDDGEVVGWDSPYRLTADEHPTPTLFCNAIPMRPAVEESASLEEGESDVWKCAYSGQYFAINASGPFLIYRELLEPRRLNVAEDFVKEKLKDTDPEVRLTKASAKEHLVEYCTPEMTAHVNAVEFPEYKKMYSHMEKGEVIEAYTLYQKMMTDDEGELHDFDEGYFTTGKGADSPQPHFAMQCR